MNGRLYLLCCSYFSMCYAYWIFNMYHSFFCAENVSWVSSYTTTVYINQNPVKHRLKHFLKTATYSWTIHRNVCDKYLSELPHLRFCRQTGFLRKSAIFQEIKVLEVRVADKVLDNRWYRKKKPLILILVTIAVKVHVYVQLNAKFIPNDSTHSRFKIKCINFFFHL